MNRSKFTNPLKGGGSFGSPSFSIRNKIERTIFKVIWTTLAVWTPPPLHKWRCFILRLMGAKIGQGVRLYGSTQIWHPRNLTIGEQAIIGPRANLYNQGHIEIGSRVVISQGAHLCASTHDVSDPHFQLILRPISIGDYAWIAADAFVGPGVCVREGAVLGARAAAFKNLEAWRIYRGNPATMIKQRSFSERT